MPCAASAARGEGDANLDAKVNVYDLAALANHYGYDGSGGSAGLTTGGAGVPEPATLASLVLGGLAVTRRRQR